MNSHDKISPGKTYSLYGNEGATRGFYQKIDALTEYLLRHEELDERELLDALTRMSKKKLGQKALDSIKETDRFEPRIMKLLHDSLWVYTTDIEKQVKSVPLLKRIVEDELSTHRSQYYLYMLEFNLVNRIFREEFHKANFKIALLPYCLSATHDSCRAKTDELNYRCTGCIKDCYVNQVSQLFGEHGVEPYIWRRQELKPMLKGMIQKHGTIGVAGIACMVELIDGMRKCMQAGIPVIGIPLDANNCPRWRDEFLDTSTDLEQVQRLLSTDK